MLTITSGLYTSENIANYLLKTIKAYRIGFLISYFIANNASNNNTTITKLSNKLVIKPFK